MIKCVIIFPRNRTTQSPISSYFQGMGLSLNGKAYNKVELLEFCQTGSFHDPAFPVFVKEWFNDSSTISVRTSGSTGNPKQIELLKDDMVASAQLTAQTFGLTSGMKALLCLPCNYIAGKMMVVRAIETGLELVTVAPSSTPLAELEVFVDFAALTPMQLAHALEQNPAKLDLVGTAIIGGGRISDPLYSKLKNRNTKLYATYGMTETATHVAIQLLNGSNPGNCFVALNGVNFTMDERSCLVIEAPHLSQKRFITNDVVELLSDTSFNWLGRYDNVINTGGVKVFPEKIEQKLGDGIIIAALPDDVLGERVIAITENNAQPDFSLITDYETPKQIFTVKEFARTENGKVDRLATVRLCLK